MKKKIFSVLLGIFIVASYFLVLPTTTKADSFECFDQGDPTNGCPVMDLENCFCDDVVIYG